MSDSLAIAAVTATLKYKLGVAVSGDPSGAQVTTIRPGVSGNGTPAPSVNLFLFHATPNAAWRNADLPTRRTDNGLLQRPVSALDLHYLLSFYGDESKLEPQRLLGRVARSLHARPVLTRELIMKALAEAASDPAQTLAVVAPSDLAKSVELVKLSPNALSLEELSKLWSVLFQTPYALSVAYQATVVLIEDDEEEPEPALPVSRRNVYVIPFAQPVVERVTPESGTHDPIVSASTLLITGRQLRGDVTLVRIGGEVVTPQSVSETEIKVPVASVPADKLRAGVQTLQVIHQILMGPPKELAPHHGFESNVSAFVLRPTVTNPKASDPQATVSVDVDPPVRAGQRVTLLLNETGGDAPAAYSFASKPPDTDLGSIDVPILGVTPGEYYVRLSIDGAESALEVDKNEQSATFGQFIGPKVTIP
jgi:Pvc16 N-terminal domain